MNVGKYDDHQWQDVQSSFYIENQFVGLGSKHTDEDYHLVGCVTVYLAERQEHSGGTCCLHHVGCPPVTGYHLQ
jgi:hypothetical protein